MADRVIEVDVSPQTIANDIVATCPLCYTEYNLCQGTPGGIACVVWYGEICRINPLCPLLSGDVIVRRKA